MKYIKLFDSKNDTRYISITKFIIKNKLKEVDVDEYFIFKVDEPVITGFRDFYPEKIYIGIFQLESSGLFFNTFKNYTEFGWRLEGVSNWDFNRMRKHIQVIDKSKSFKEVDDMIDNIKKYNL